MQKSARWFLHTDVLPLLISIMGVITYLIMAWGHAYGQVTVIDEGLYLYKGLLFVSGDYRPFQDFGPLTNHMPLSFLIPGWTQMLFGPGIRTGRYLSVILGLFMLVGLWLVTRRQAGKWWAVMVIWAVALNPGLFKMYSQATSQILVASILMWVLVFVVGDNPKTWQILFGVVLAGLLLMTRINMAPVLILVLVYVFWNSGIRTGILASVVGLTVVILSHAVYWPEILKIWANWIPSSLTPFLAPFRVPPDAIPYWDPKISLGSRIGVLYAGLRIHLVSTIGFLGMILNRAFRRKSSRLLTNYKTVWFLVSLYGVLLLFHGAASLGLNYCVHCFRVYLAFFSPLGLIILAIWGREIGQLSDKRAVSILLVVLVSIPFMLGLPPVSELINSMLAIGVPRVAGFSLLPGMVELQVFIGNKLGWNSQQSQRFGELIFWLLVVFVPILVQLLSYLYRRIKFGIESTNLLPGLTAFLILWLSISTVFFGNEYRDYDCGEDTLLANEIVGAYLGEKIPESSTIYWGVGRAPIPMLYLPNRYTFPPQLNGDYTFMLQGDSYELLRYGYWDISTSEDWLMQADYVLIEVRNYPLAGDRGFNETLYDEIERTPPTRPCSKESSIMIFKRE